MCVCVVVIEFVYSRLNATLDGKKGSRVLRTHRHKMVSSW